MVKEPRPGRVKTRLGRDIGHTAAAWWFRHQTRRLIRRLRDPRWDLILAVSPDYQGLTSKVWPQDPPRSPQGPGHLGQKMLRQMHMAPGRACVIGADIPDITPAHVHRAFAQLGAHDAVFGPAPDGGYWLVGFKHPHRVRPRVFQTVRWSSPHALADSVASLPGFRIAMVQTLRDIDTIDDLKAVQAAFRNDAAHRP